jgi:hypothetical protein
MKYYLQLLIVFVFIGCKKSRYDKYAIGSEKKMTVTQHDATIQGVFGFGTAIDHLELDLDEDGTKDVVFVSVVDSLDSGTGVEIWNVYMDIYNPDFEVLEMLNSGEQYYAESPYQYPTDGGFMWNRTLRTGCETEDGVSASFRSNSPRTFSESDLIQPEEYDWTAQSYTGYLELSHSGYEYQECVFPDTSDNLYCDIVIQEPTCYPVPTDEKTFLLFRKADINGYYLGWIEVMLTDNNKLSIVKSAISDKPLDF